MGQNGTDGHIPNYVGRHDITNVFFSSSKPFYAFMSHSNIIEA